MRLFLQLDKTCPSNIPNRKIVYFINGVATVEDLSKQLSDDLGLAESVQFSIDGYVVFPKSLVQIFKESELVTVSLQTECPEIVSISGSENSKDASSTSSESEETSSSDSSSDDTDQQESDKARSNHSDLPKTPNVNWKSVQLANIKKDDVLMYKILEVTSSWNPQESEWRYGLVSCVTEETGDLLLLPWPDSSIHPDPKFDLRKAQEKEAGGNASSKKKKSLLVPSSEYTDSGILLKNIRDFIYLRKVPLETAQKFGGAKKRKSPPKNDLPKPKRPHSTPVQVRELDHLSSH